MDNKEVCLNKLIEKLKSFNLKKIIIIIAIAVILIALFIMPKRYPCYSTGIGHIIYFLTFVAIVYYTVETKLLREATLGRPVISIIKNVSDTIEIRNDGSNIAYNIKVYFLYNGITRHKIEIAILGKGLLYKVGIANIEISINEIKKRLSELINSSPPDPNLKVLIDYSDSVEKNGRQFMDKWKLDETVIMSSANEGRFRMTRSETR